MRSSPPPDRLLPTERSTLFAPASLLWRFCSLAPLAFAVCARPVSGAPSTERHLRGPACTRTPREWCEDRTMHFDSPASGSTDLLEVFFDLLGPTCCAGCLQSRVSRRRPLCSRCVRRLPWWRRADGCPRCGFDPLPRSVVSDGSAARRSVCPGCLSEGAALHACHAALRYEGLLQSWIPHFKGVGGAFGPNPTVRRSIGFLADELARGLARQIESAARDAPDLIVPIPLHPRRQRTRGFNQCDPIARAVARRVGRPWRADVLARRRATPPQAALHGEVRRQNVRGAFRAVLRGERPERVWIIDDVLTTGATLEAAASALLDAGAEEVHGICLAATRPLRRLSPLPNPSTVSPGAQDA